MTGAASRVPGCLVVAACRDDERARESPSQDGPAHGELTRALVRQFKALSPAELTDLRWGRIWRAVEADVRTANPRQSPWLSGNFGRRVFGFGGDEDGDPGFAVTVAGSQYRLDVGSLAGVTEDATIAVYGATPPAFPPPGTVADRDARKGLLKVTRADRATCEAVALTSFELPEAPRGRLVAAGQAARLRVALNPHDEALAALIAGSPLAEVVTGGPADLTLVRRADGAWALTDDVYGTGEVAGEPVLAAVPADALAFATPLVEHYAAYITPLRMARACRDLPSLLRMWLLDCNNARLDPAQAQSPDLPQIKAGTRAPYELSVGDRLCIVVENAASERLAVTLIDCAASGKVLILGEKQMPAQSRHVFWLNEVLAQAFVAGLPANREVGVDRLAAIATTRTDVSLRRLAVGNSFDKLLERLRERDGTRDLGDGGGEMPAERWTSALTALRITPRRN
jgi:hypothetical protein